MSFHINHLGREIIRKILAVVLLLSQVEQHGLNES